MLSEPVFVNDGDAVLEGVLFDFLGQFCFADAENLSQESPGFANGQEVLFEGFGLADGEFFGDAVEEESGAIGNGAWEGVPQLFYEVFGGAAVFAVHQPEAPGPVEEKVNFGMGLAGADAVSGLNFEAESALDGWDAEFEKDGSGGEFEAVAVLGRADGVAAGGEVWEGVLAVLDEVQETVFFELLALGVEGEGLSAVLDF